MSLAGLAEEHGARSPQRVGWLSSRPMQGSWGTVRIRWAVVGVLVAVVLAAGCSSGDDDSSTFGTTTSDPPAGGGDEPAGAGQAAGSGAAAGLTLLSGVWEGTYECGQGTSGLRLTVDDRANGDVGAAFEHVPDNGDADAATGSFSMNGTKSEDTLALEAHEWLEQGDDDMVGLEANLADRSDTEVLEGTVVGDGCSNFTVQRVSTDPWYVGTWQGKYGCAQGLTGLTLTVDSDISGDVSAVFEFYEVPENPGTPNGSFNMAGTYEDGQLSLVGTDWIDQPEGYVVVDYESNTDLGIDPDRLFGTVLGPGCNIFEMRKVEE